MKREESFAEVLESVEKLSMDAREELIEIVRKCTIEERRSEIAGEIIKARSEYRRVKRKSSSAQNIMKDR
jgi:hypothetical protein